MSAIVSEHKGPTFSVKFLSINDVKYSPFQEKNVKGFVALKTKITWYKKVLKTKIFCAKDVA